MIKKLLPYILIAVILVQLFAPFTVGMGEKNNLVVGTNKAEAADCQFLSVEYDQATSKSDPRPPSINLAVKTTGCTNYFISGVIKISSGLHEVIKGFPYVVITQDNFSFNVVTGENHCATSDCETILTLNMSRVANDNNPVTYTSKKEAGGKDFLDFKCTSVGANNAIVCDKKLDWDILSLDLKSPDGTKTDYTKDIWYFETTDKDGKVISRSEKNYTTENECILARTEADLAKSPGSTVGICKKGVQQKTSVDLAKESVPPTDGFPACSIFSPSTYGGCIGIGLYWLFFKPTSFIFGLAGKILDFTIMYSISDASYRSAFVVEGWGLIRDFCNMFFIFVLLYIAFSTILNINSGKTKEMIIKVVVIGLLINFSLFATQVIIDASNVLTRVFYNQKTIVTGTAQKDASGNPLPVTSQLGDFGEIKLSEAIVSKVDPQQLIIQASTVSSIPQKGVTNEGEQPGGISAGSFIIVVILATAVNVVGIIAFLSSAIIFISRVIGLWLAMILAPLAFFSYAVPGLQDMEMIGWKKWWPETLKLAFLAPVFVFFMYLIVGFMDKGLGILSAVNKSGLSFVVAIAVPFVFIMILLMKAKDIAKDLSGKMGQSISSGIAATGGMMLGGAALGTAMLGRKTIGSVSKYVQNDTARKKDATTFGGYKDWSLGKKLNPFAYVGQAGKTAMAGIATGIHKIPAGKDASGSPTTLGKKMKEADEGFGHKTHATHTLDAKMQSEFGHQYGKDAKYKDLTEHDQKIVNAEVDKDELAKFQYGKQFKDLEAPQAADIQDAYLGRGAYVGHERRAISDENGKTIRLDDATATLAPGEKIKSNYFVNAAKANAAMGEFVQSLRKGSYDVRNISKLKATSKGFPKMGIGLAAAIAGGVRLGLKSGVGIEHGTGQKDFMKDLGNVVTEALKGVKINVGSSGGDHGGGAKEVKSVGH